MDFSENDIWRLKEPERATEDRTFHFAGRDWPFTIYVDGMEDAERWQSLLSAIQHGQTQKTLARISGGTYAEKVTPPDGATFEVTDPSYIGSVKLLHSVLVNPRLSFEALLALGHRGGKGFLDVVDWAAKANGVEAELVARMAEIEKNARSPVEH